MIFLQFKFEVTVKPKEATLKIDDKAQKLDADGKLVMEEVEFGTELSLDTQLTGYVTDKQTVKIDAKDNIVVIDLKKDKVGEMK